MTRPPARLATISSSRPCDWACALEHKHSAARRNGKIPRIRRGSVQRLFIASLSYGVRKPRRYKELLGRNGRGSRLRLRQQFIERRAIKIVAAANHSGDLSRVPDIFQRIRVQQHQIRRLAVLDGAEVAVTAKKLGCSLRRCSERLARCEACANQLSKLLVQAVASKNKWVERVGTNQERYSRTMQLARQFPIVSGLPRQPRSALLHLRIVEGIPPLFGQRRRNEVELQIIGFPVLRMRGDVQRSQRWRNPRAILLQGFKQSARPLRAVRRVRLVRDLLPRDRVALLFRGNQALPQIVLPG